MPKSMSRTERVQPVFRHTTQRRRATKSAKGESIGHNDTGTSHDASIHRNDETLPNLARSVLPVSFKSARTDTALTGQVGDHGNASSTIEKKKKVE